MNDPGTWRERARDREMPEGDALLAQMAVHLETALQDMIESRGVVITLARLQRQEIPLEPVVIRVATPVATALAQAGAQEQLYDVAGLPTMRDFPADPVGVLQRRLISYPVLYRLGRRAYRVLSSGRVHYPES